VCSQVSTNVTVDPSRATVKDLVEDVLVNKLSYADGVTLRNESTVLYDPDFDDNLSKTFADLSLGKNSLLTVVDEKPENPRVDLSLVLVEKYVSPLRTLLMLTCIGISLRRKRRFRFPRCLNLRRRPHRLRLSLRRMVQPAKGARSGATRT
jgi:Ubiquitin/SUMO-activating enzyme ubiquitin-like domain